MAAAYVPRSPTASVLYGVVRAHLTELLAAVDAQTGGSDLPGFVVNEFRKFLRCGCWPTASRACGARTARSSVRSGCPLLSALRGRMTVLATIEDPAVIQRILTHLGLSVEGEALPAPRGSP